MVRIAPLNPPPAPIQLTDSIRRFIDGMQQAGPLLAESLRQMVEQVNAMLRPIREKLIEAANSPVYLAGLEGRYYTRAAFGVTDEDDLTMLLADIMEASRDHELFLVTPHNRALIAAAALRGYVTHRPTMEVPVLAWHRQLGSCRVTVGRAS